MFLLANSACNNSCGALLALSFPASLTSLLYLVSLRAPPHCDRSRLSCESSSARCPKHNALLIVINYTSTPETLERKYRSLELKGPVNDVKGVQEGFDRWAPSTVRLYLFRVPLNPGTVICRGLLSAIAKVATFSG